jgi:type VI secretion system protein VasG
MATHKSNDIRSLVSKLDRHGRQILTQAAELAYASRHVALDVEHLLVCFFEQETDAVLRPWIEAGFDAAGACGQLKNLLASFKTEHALPPALSDRLVNILHDAWFEVSLDGDGDAVVTIATLIKSICDSEKLFPALCREVPALVGLVAAIQKTQGPVNQAADLMPMTSALAKFTVDLTAKAREGEIDPVIGRDAEIAQVIEILLRRRQNNPILTGEAGVGKTAIVEGLARRIASGLVPKALLHVRLCSLDMGLLRAGAAMRGEIELRIKAIIGEIATAEQPVILFIDEAHTLVAGGGGQGEQGDIANMIKPELARGSLRTIAATTWAEYKRYFEKDAALSRRFQTVRVDEPNATVAKDILQALVPVLQAHHGVYIMQSAVDAAVRLSSRYIQGRQLPDKAISVLDTACARAVSALTGPVNELLRLQQRRELLTQRLEAWQCELAWTGVGAEAMAQVQQDLDETLLNLNALAAAPSIADIPPGPPAAMEQPAVRVGGEDVASVIADWTGVPSQKMLLDQFTLATQLEESLAKRVVGQTAATRLISDRLRAYTAKLEDPTRPIGVFLLTGPSGVGKTETAHAIAEAFFGKAGITVVNMSEYQEAHTVSKLKGAPAGYVGYGQGGVLTEAIRRQPYGLLLLDEVEKAHPDVLDLFLQVFDKGFMEDSEGMVVDFKNVLVLMTSNAGTDLLSLPQGTLNEGSEDAALRMPQLEAQLLRHFKPAFLGRAQVVPYFALGESELMQIINMKLSTIAQRFESTYHASLHVESAVRQKMVAQCASQTIGARWLDQFISEHLLSRLSLYVLGCLSAQQCVTDVRIYLGPDDRIDVESDQTRCNGTDLPVVGDAETPALILDDEQGSGEVLDVIEVVTP